MNPLPPPTASEETTETVIIEHGHRTFLGGTTTTMTMDAEGVRRFTTTTQRVQANGRIVDPTAPLYSCACGKTLLPAESITVCGKCRAPSCFPCIRTKQGIALCRSCSGGVLTRIAEWLLG